MGIPSDRIFSVVMAISAGARGAGGRAGRAVSHGAAEDGLLPIVKAFAIVIVGGLGSIPGSILAALMLGYCRDHRRLHGLDLVDRDRLVWSRLVMLVFRPAGIARPARGVLSRRVLKPIDLAGAVVVVAVLALRRCCSASNYLIGVLTVSVIYAHLGGDLGLHVRPDRPRELRPFAVHRRRRLHRGLPGHQFRLQRLVQPSGVRCVMAVLFRLIVGVPTLRLKGPYFALAMLSASAIMQRLMLIFWEIPAARRASTASTADPLAAAYYYFVLAVLVAAVAMLIALARSHWGLMLRAIRGDEATCQAAGINVTFYKIASLMISAAFAGARRRAVRALPAAGEPAAVLGRGLDHDHHHGLCRRHGEHLRARRAARSC